MHIQPGPALSLAPSGNLLDGLQIQRWRLIKLGVSEPVIRGGKGEDPKFWQTSFCLVKFLKETTTLAADIEERSLYPLHKMSADRENGSLSVFSLDREARKRGWKRERESKRIRGLVGENIHKYDFLITKKELKLVVLYQQCKCHGVQHHWCLQQHLPLIQPFHPVSGVYDGVNFPLGSHAPLMTDHLWRIFSPPPAPQAAFNI